MQQLLGVAFARQRAHACRANSTRRSSWPATLDLARQCRRDLVAKSLDGRRAIEDRKLGPIGATIARLVHYQLARGLYRLAAETVGAGLDAHGVLTFRHHSPFDETRQEALVVADGDRGAVAEKRVGEGD